MRNGDFASNSPRLGKLRGDVAWRILRHWVDTHAKTAPDMFGPHLRVELGVFAHQITARGWSNARPDGGMEDCVVELGKGARQVFVCFSFGIVLEVSAELLDRETRETHRHHQLCCRSTLLCYMVTVLRHCISLWKSLKFVTCACVCLLALFIQRVRCND